MADYWKSNERKYCDFCKCWISDNKASISFHESGKRHKLNVAKRITDISRNSEKAEKERKKMDAELRKMEDAAMRSYAQDIHSRGDFTTRSIAAVMNAATSGTSFTSNIAPTAYRVGRQVDPMRLEGESDDEDAGMRVKVEKLAPESVPDASLWVEGKSGEGHTYYWNVKSYESVWKPPKEGFLSLAEYERINQLAIKQQELQQAAEAKHFRENVNEEVARYNREKLKKIRKPETPQEKEERRLEKERKQAFRTEEEAATQEIGTWQIVETKPPPAPINWELPKVDNYNAPPVVSRQPVELPLKRFKEKTFDALPKNEEDVSASSSFKKRKFAAKGNARKRLDDD